jgi:hypothetical protein
LKKKILIYSLVVSLALVAVPQFALASLAQWWEDLLSAQRLTKAEESVHEGTLMSWIHRAEKTGSVFRMKDLVDFDWDRLYIFPSQTTNEQMSKEIGFKWAGLSPDEQKNEELCFLIFVKDRKVVQYFKYHKFYGDFSQVYQKRGYSPEEAVFTAQKSSQLLHGEFPPLVIKSDVPK